jgi:hypothetical protein
MDLGPALSAAQGYFQARDQRELRDRDRQRYEWERQRTESEMSLLGDKTAAARANYRGTIADADARNQLRPGETRNAMTRQNQETIGLERAGARQGNVEDALDNEALIKKNLTDVDAKDLPRAIALKRQQGIINEADMRQASIGALARLADEGNNDAMVKFLNDMNDVSTDEKNRLSARVARVGVSQQNPDVLVAVDEQGNPIRSFSISKLRKMAYPSQVTKLGDGDKLVQTDGLGNVQVLADNPKTFAPGTDADGTALPADPRTAKWLVENKIARDMPEAWEMVRASKEASRGAFIRDYTARNAGVKSPEELQADAARIYDNTNAKSNSAAGGGMGGPRAPTDPSVREFIGLPK